MKQMRILLIKQNELKVLTLPINPIGSYWVEDSNSLNKKINLVNIHEANGKWEISSNLDTKLFVDGVEKTECILSENTFYSIKENYAENYQLLYCDEVYNSNIKKYMINSDIEITIGNSPSNLINYTCKYVKPQHAKLIYKYKEKKWSIETSNLVYVNNQKVENEDINHGDVIFVMGLRIIVNGPYIMVNNPSNKVVVDKTLSLVLNEKLNYPTSIVKSDDDKEVKVFDKKDYFFRAPRFRTVLEKEEVVIDAPPEKGKPDEMPFIYTVGPMVTMGMTSMVMGIVALNGVLNGTQTLSSAMPSLVIAFAMLLTMILWPVLSKQWQKKQEKKKEKLRQERYSKYIDSKKIEITSIIAKQKQIIIENNLPIGKCKEIIELKGRNLWERKVEHDDFLEIRIGIGNREPEIDLKYPDKHFELEEDNLKQMVQHLGDEVKLIHDVPVTVKLTDKYISAIFGEPNITNEFIKGFLLKLMTFQSYEDVKIVVLTNEKNKNKWDYLKMSPYCWDDEKKIRFFCSNSDDLNQISNYLKSVLMERKYPDAENMDESEADYHYSKPYYVVITDDFNSIRNTDIIKEILKQKINYGFSLIINAERIIGLPNECSAFINIGQKSSGMFENDLILNKQKAFLQDLDLNLDMNKITEILANIPIELEQEKYKLPQMLSFLEMYDAGSVEQLNAEKRWETNNPIASLKVPVGKDENGELFNLDLHEKFHGPHGLIAGMTGSGKSEFIITFILSMAVNYHPNEVAFALIDYKGGGLAGAFENKETKIRLPHLVGTITNLDIVEMNRSLASIQSELKRRQRIFNKARETSGESTIDIYKYQKLFRDGKVKEAVPHLFIISDEFAELKTQQPEFMDQLISTARIGRSLGVHLILATQKPSGVVDDQIWSNSKFRVCLKVQDKSDSVDMIKCPDAAAIKEVGRFYLQVGYNEFFALGQSAWCGAPYIKQDKLRKKIDTDIDVIDNVGFITKSVETSNKKELIASYGEQLTNILKYLSDIAQKNNINLPKLWLDSIPDTIYVNNLVTKYSYKQMPHVINPIIGEYDDPNNQQQHLLTMPLSTEGNAIIYGSVGSGKENLLNTIVYSCVMCYTVDEVNIYIVDCGAETLVQFNKIPHVGDVILSNDVEKIANLLKFIQKKIEERKKLFTNYGGSFQNYCNNSGEVLPTILIIINYYEVFSELYQDYEDTIIKLTREGFKYGIIFILTTNGVSNIRYKLTQNFKQTFMLQLNDESDYSTVLGNVRGKYPSKLKGRGLIKKGEIYEFQSAYMCNIEQTNEFVKQLESYLNQKYTQTAPEIKILPDSIGIEEIKEELTNLRNVPIGIEKQTLDISTYNFKRFFTNIIATSNVDNISSFIQILYKEMKLLKANLIVIDASSLLDDEQYENYYSTDFYKIVTNLKQIIESNTETICIIVGINDFINNLTEENKTLFSSLFENVKDIQNFNFVIADGVENIKTMAFEPWMKKTLSNNNAIWLGDGLGDQFTISTTTRPAKLNEENSEDFGYVIKSGKPVIIKVIGAKGNDLDG